MSTLSAKIPVAAAIVLIAGVTAILEPSFLSLGNLSNMLVQSAALAVVALGMTFVIISGGIDLSVGATLAFGGVILGIVTSMSGNVAVGCVAALAAGTALGAANAFFVCRVGLQPFLATLGIMGAARGGAFLLSGGMPISGALGGLSFLYERQTIVPVVVLWIGLAILGSVLLHVTVLGRRLYAVGSNERAAALIGISVSFHRAFSYCASGCLAALAGILVAARLDSSQPLAGNLYELDAIAAAVIGGGSLTGGKGDLLGTALGVLLIVELRNAVTIAGLPSHSQPLVIGVVLLLAVTLDQRTAKSKEE